MAWSPSDAALAVEWFGEHAYAVLGTELWVIQAVGINSFPRGRDGLRAVWGSTVGRRTDESWSSFVARSTSETRAYLQTFDTADVSEPGHLYFNFVWSERVGF